MNYDKQLNSLKTRLEQRLPGCTPEVVVYPLVVQVTLTIPRNGFRYCYIRGRPTDGEGWQHLEDQIVYWLGGGPYDKS